MAYKLVTMKHRQTLSSSGQELRHVTMGWMRISVHPGTFLTFPRFPWLGGLAWRDRGHLWPHSKWPSLRRGWIQRACRQTQRSGSGGKAALSSEGAWAPCQTHAGCCPGKQQVHLASGGLHCAVAWTRDA